MPTYPRTLATLALATGLAATVAIGADSASAAPAASNVATRKADIDGDTKPDTVTLSLHSVRGTSARYLLTVKTAKRTMTQIIYKDTYDSPVPAKYVLQGVGPVDGARGNEILLDVSPDVGDAEGYAVYTVKNGKIKQSGAPGSPFRGEWACMGPWLGIARGYTFSYDAKARRTVTYHDLSTAGRTYSGPSTTYTWTSKGWQRTSTRTTTATAEQAKKYVYWHGITWR